MRRDEVLRELTRESVVVGPSTIAASVPTDADEAVTSRAIRIMRAARIAMHYTDALRLAQDVVLAPCDPLGPRCKRAFERDRLAFLMRYCTDGDEE